MDAGKSRKTSGPSHERPALVAAHRSLKKVAQQMESRAPAVAGRVVIRGGKPAPAIRSPRGTVGQVMATSDKTVITRRRILQPAAEARRRRRHSKESSAPAEAVGSLRLSPRQFRDESCARAEAKQARAPAEAGSSRSRSSRNRSPSVTRPGKSRKLLRSPSRSPRARPPSAYRPSGGFQPPALHVRRSGHLLAHHPHGWFVPAMYGKESTTEALAEAGSSSSFKTTGIRSGTKRKRTRMIGKTTSQSWYL